MEGKIPLAFAAGLVSFATPCVLPLVPGYLAVISGENVGVGGRRVVLASLPFVAGFTAVFVALGAAAAAAGSLFGENRELFLAVAGLIVVVFGFAMMGLLPLPFLDRLAAPGLVEGARSTGSAALLGGAFGLCAAPCVGPVLAGILALAGEGQTVAQGTILLLVYSAGLALPFLAVGVGFDRAMRAGRWLRDHYQAFRVVSGALLVALGLLLFFDRLWWIRVGVNRVFEFFGIGV
jgi:cytochrome c-type biogenesis protein